MRTVGAIAGAPGCELRRRAGWPPARAAVSLDDGARAAIAGRRLVVSRGAELLRAWS